MTTVAVLSVTRRVAVVWDGTSSQTVRVSSACLQVLAGDLVVLDVASNPPMISEILPRQNTFARSVGRECKALAANIDLVLVVAAVPPLFNTEFVDRVLTLCGSQQIASRLVLNKVDMRSDLSDYLVALYQSLGFPVSEISAKHGKGISELNAALPHKPHAQVLLTGVSGVGKSTLLNQLVPGADARVGEVSARTGQGKQTTSQLIGYPTGANGPIFFDLPGIQNFGVGHIGKDALIHGFPELKQRYGECPYDDCSHLYEEECAIKNALDADEIAESRYASYVSMRLEVDALKDYERSDDE